MKKIRLIRFVMSLAMLLSLAAPAFAQEEGSLPPQTANSLDASITSGCSGENGAVPLRSEQILKTGSAALLYELQSDTMVYGYNMDGKMYPGSLVKLMTALIAIELGDLEDEVVVTESMMDKVPEASKIWGMTVGEKFTLRDLIYCMVLASVNDASVVIADHVSGSQDAFVDAMNAKAKELGCTNTHFTNTHGVHDDNQYTTARDLLRILKYGIQNEAFMELIAAEKYYMPETEFTDTQTVFTENYMHSMMIMEEYYDYRVTGGKPAANQDGLRHLVVTAEDEGLSYIGIVMETKPGYADNGYDIQTYQECVEMKALLDMGFENYEVKQIIYEGQISNRFTVTNGANSVAVGPTRSVKSVLPKDVDSGMLSYRFQRTGGNLTAPVKKGEIVDILQVWYGTVCIAQADLISMNSAAVATANPNLLAAQEGLDTQGLGKALMILGTIAAVVLGGFGVLYVIRMTNIAVHRSRRRKRRTSRRRSR